MSIGPWLRRWGGSVAVAILDQAILSAANFAVNIALARWLDPSGYGAYAIGLALVLLLTGPHSALLGDAMPVVGARHFAGRNTSYLRALLILHAGFGVLMSVVIVAIAAMWPNSIAPDWWIGIIVASTMMLTLWLVRGACYFEMRPDAALFGSVSYALVLLGLVGIAHQQNWLSAPAALALMGASSLAASGAMAWRLGLLSQPSQAADLRLVIREHWAYGRWTLGAAIAHGIASGLYTPLVGALVGLEQSALLRAVQNLVAPLQQGVTGAAMVAYPSMSRRVAKEGPGYLQRRGRTFLFAGLIAAALYAATVSFLARPLLTLLYGVPFYVEHVNLVWIGAAGLVTTTAAQLLGILVRVIDRPQAVLWSKLAVAVWFVTVGVLLVRTHGGAGALWGAMGGGLIEASVLAILLVRYLSLAARPIERPPEVAQA